MLTIKSEPYKEYETFENLKAGDLFRADIGATDEIWCTFMKADTQGLGNDNNNDLKYALRLDNGVLYGFLPTRTVKPIKDAELLIR